MQLFRGRDLLFCLEEERISKAGPDNPVSLFLFFIAGAVKAD